MESIVAKQSTQCINGIQTFTYI